MISFKINIVRTCTIYHYSYIMVTELLGGQNWLFFVLELAIEVLPERVEGDGVNLGYREKVC